MICLDGGIVSGSSSSPTGDYHDLHKYSVEDYGFWLDLWEYVGIVYSVPPSKVGYVESSLLVLLLNLQASIDTRRWAHEGTSYLVPRRATELCRESIVPKR